MASIPQCGAWIQCINLSRSSVVQKNILLNLKLSSQIRTADWTAAGGERERGKEVVVWAYRRAWVICLNSRDGTHTSATGGDALFLRISFNSLLQPTGVSPGRGRGPGVSFSDLRIGDKSDCF